MPPRRRIIPDGEEPVDYSVPQAARLIKDTRGRPYSTRWLYKEIKAGKVATFKDENGYMRITVGELERFKREELKHTSGRASPLENPAWRHARARAGGYAKSATHSAEEVAKPLQDGLRRSLEDRVDPDHELRERNPAEFHRRVEALRLSQIQRAQARSHLSRM